MNVIQKYVVSLNASNLKNDDINKNLDPIMAMAMSDTSGIGSLLWRIKYANDLSIYARLLEKWTAIVTKKSIKEQWKKDIRPKHIARLSLQYWINDICDTCQGTAKAPHPANDQVRSNDPCVVCNGTAKKPISGFKSQKEYIGNCLEMLKSEERILGSKVILKLSNSFNL